MNKMPQSIQNGSRRGGGCTSEWICVEAAPTTPSALAAVASRLLIPERSLPHLARSIPAALLVGAMTIRNFSDKAIAENK
jgi:hypothetical protein